MTRVILHVLPSNSFTKRVHMPTQKDVAKKAGVSRTSVSNFINNKGYVSAAASKRIAKAINELNYRPNVFARSLKSKNTKTIGVLFPDVDSSFSSTIIRNIEKTAHANEYNIILSITDNVPEKERENIRSLLDRCVDGFIINPTFELNTCQYQELSGKHVVYVHRCTPPVDDNAALIKLNNRSAVRLGIEYLIELGHKNIGIINGPALYASGPERFHCLIECMKSYNIPIQDRFIVTASDYSEYQGYIKTKALLHRGSLPTAIFSLCGGLSIGSLKAVRESGLRIPEDISFISFDNSNYTEYLDPPITTIMQPASEFGIVAVNTLFKMIQGEQHANNCIELIPELIIRNSCSKPESAYSM